MPRNVITFTFTKTKTKIKTKIKKPPTKSIARRHTSTKIPNQVITEPNQKDPISYTTSTNIHTSLPWKYTIDDRMTKFGSKMSNKRIFKNTYPILSSILYHVQCCDVGMPPDNVHKGMRKVSKGDLRVLKKPPFLVDGDVCWISGITYNVTQSSLETYVMNADDAINDKSTEIVIASRHKVGKPNIIGALTKAHTPSPKNETKKMPFQRPKFTMKPVPHNPSTTITMYELTNKLSYKNSTKHSSIRIVDFPVYNFECEKFINRQDEWKENVKHYIANRGMHLKRILLLVDARYSLRKTDQDFFIFLQECYNMVDGEMPAVQVVLTKCNLCKQFDLAKRVIQVTNQVDEILQTANHLPVMLVGHTENDEKDGILNLQSELSSIVTLL